MFTGNNPKDTKAPLGWLILLWLLGCILALTKLGSLPLRDFDEATVARVAFEISQQTGIDRLLPTLWGDSYLNKPPGLHGLIAIAIQLRNITHPISKLPSEQILRLVPALLSTLIIPIGGLIQWKLKPNNRTCSITTGAILLTLLPIARHGRLAMLDGTQLTAMGLLWLLILSLNNSQMDRWKALGIGIATSSMLLLKAPLFLPATVAAFIPFHLEGNLRRFWSWPTLTWLSIGLLPGIGWHIWHYFQRGAGALWLWTGDGAGRVLFDIGEGSDLGWKVPIVEILEGGWPWLVLWPFAIALAWKERNSRWGRWTLSSQIVLAISILPLKTQLPWYSHPLWLPISLLCASPLTRIVENTHGLNEIPGKNILKKIPILWFSLGILLLMFGVLGFSKPLIILRPYRYIALAVGAGWGIGGWLLCNSSENYRRKGLICLIAGNLAGLCLLMNSPLWLWELNENWTVKPIAALANKAEGYETFIDGSHERPSLNWYAGKRIRTWTPSINAPSILSQNPSKVMNLMPQMNCKVTEKEGTWNLLICSSPRP